MWPAPCTISLSRAKPTAHFRGEMANYRRNGSQARRGPLRAVSQSALLAFAHSRCLSASGWGLSWGELALLRSERRARACWLTAQASFPRPAALARPLSLGSAPPDRTTSTYCDLSSPVLRDAGREPSARTSPSTFPSHEAPCTAEGRERSRSGEQPRNRSTRTKEPVNRQRFLTNARSALSRLCPSCRTLRGTGGRLLYVRRR